MSDWKIGRNEPCPCRSGKKYKRCCGDEAKRAAANQEAWALPTPPTPQADADTKRVRISTVAAALMIGSVLGGRQ